MHAARMDPLCCNSLRIVEFGAKSNPLEALA